MNTAKKIAISKLKSGDRFSEIPAASHGPSVVLESWPSGDLWRVSYSNSNLVNSPGVLYAHLDAKVRLLTPAMAIYLCRHCGKRVKRASVKQWVKSYCVSTGKTSHLMRQTRP